MRLRHIPGSEEEIANSRWVYQTPEELKKGMSSPLYIEVGMGKGRFIIDNAKKYPNIDFIGIEMYESVMVKATRRLDRMEEGDRPENLHFIRMDASDIQSFFPEKSVDRIYLNFSDPWPKTRHAHRRLESEAFLRKFSYILKDEGTIEFKTDNKDLFDFALLEYEKAGFEMLHYTYDLHSDEEAVKENIMTEYEEKFSAKGNKICKYTIKKISGNKD